MAPFRLALPASLLLFAACKPAAEPGLTFLTSTQTDALVASSLEFVGDPQLRHTVVSDPKSELSARAGLVVAIVPRTDCTECYRVDSTDSQHFVITGGAPLGIQYGVAHVLETFGYHFFHPWHTGLPGTLSNATQARRDQVQLGKEYAPQVDLRRGLHLHTLHPIEPMYDFWEPGASNLEGARRTIDFLVKNRGNYLQWCALNNIEFDKTVSDPWRVHTRAILDEAHKRGVKAGISIQLFGKSNLQNAFDLIDTDPDPVTEMKRRLHVLLDGLPFDSVNMSFGEFLGADPAAFVEQINVAYDALQEVAPKIEMTATIHVGNYPNLRVTYMGRDQLYYFLVRYANPAIHPWIHSVMYFNLFEDAGLAYLHETFSEHRDFLEEHLRAQQPIGYEPESAYWVSFDNAVPTYLPVYMRSRWLDLSELKKAGRLRDHVLFSTGWEWGYWQTDAATLRMTYELPASWDDPAKDFFASYGPSGEKLGALIGRLGEAQHEGLIGKRLAAYVAGRDQLIDAGKVRGIVSQPDRKQYDEVSAMTPANRAAFVTATLEPLRKLADDVSAIDVEAKALALSDSDAFLSEMNDSFDITARRIRYVRALYEATVAKADTGDEGGWLARADTELDAAKLTMSHRRKRLHDPDPLTLLRNTPNPTFYQYGYLRDADSLCFWLRERAQVRNVILQTGEAVPGCVL